MDEREPLPDPARSVIRWLAAGSVLLSVISVAAVASGVELLVALFAVVRERSVPTWYSSAVLLLGAGAFGWAAVLAGRTQQRLRRAVTGLAAILLVMSVDEVARFHEKLGAVGRLVVAEEGFTRFPWVVPGVAVGLVLLLVVRRLAAELPRATSLLLVLGVSLVLVASLGVEALSGWVFDTYGDGVQYAVLYHLEELVEMIGFVLLAGSGASVLRVDSRTSATVVRLASGARLPSRT